MKRQRGGGGEAGYSLVALMASITIMIILMGAAAPSWRYLMQNDREEELIFRGGSIADAIQHFQKKNGNALPISLEVLVKGKFLRKEYKDPMTREGKWRLIHQGDAVLPAGAPVPASSPGFVSPPPTTRPAGPSSFGGAPIGPLIGVASTSTDKSLRLFNGRSHYNEWIFAVGQPRLIGGQLGPAPTPGLGAPPSPRPSPSAGP